VESRPLCSKRIEVGIAVLDDHVVDASASRTPNP
jgi:hypothetical protein